MHFNQTGGPRLECSPAELERTNGTYVDGSGVEHVGCPLRIELTQEDAFARVLFRLNGLRFNMQLFSVHAVLSR